MLFEMTDNKILADKKPYIKDLRLNFDMWQRLARVKFGFIKDSSPDGDVVESLDFALGWHNLEINLRRLIRLYSLRDRGRKELLRVFPKLRRHMLEDPGLQESLGSSSIVFKFYGKELNRDISFQGKIAFNILSRKFFMKVVYENKAILKNDTISREIKRFRDIFELIKSVVVTTNDKN